ncbi:VOC family protein [Sphingobacterium multivorum]|uniref:VOC family protein n=1 Tax=Sphingobacterium multivorum TaxID=28454 RepID=UPI0028A84D5D|nr:VOC family protein [Sphingobacterium multivorum]
MEGYRNPGVYFEIPVTDMERAVRFYSQTFNFSFEREEFDGNQMAYFPFQEMLPGITGALGFAVAEIEDLEGNRIGLHQKL